MKTTDSGLLFGRRCEGASRHQVGATQGVRGTASRRYGSPALSSPACSRPRASRPACSCQEGPEPPRTGRQPPSRALPRPLRIRGRSAGCRCTPRAEDRGPGTGHERPRPLSTSCHQVPGGRKTAPPRRPRTLVVVDCIPPTNECSDPSGRVGVRGLETGCEDRISVGRSHSYSNWTDVRKRLLAAESSRGST